MNIQAIEDSHRRQDFPRSAVLGVSKRLQAVGERVCHPSPVQKVPAALRTSVPHGFTHSPLHQHSRRTILYSISAPTRVKASKSTALQGGKRTFSKALMRSSPTPLLILPTKSVKRLSGCAGGPCCACGTMPGGGPCIRICMGMAMGCPGGKPGWPGG